MPAGPGLPGRVGGVRPESQPRPAPRAPDHSVRGSCRSEGIPMVIVMAPSSTDAELEDVVAHVRTAGGSAFVSRGVTRTIVGVVGTEEVLEALDVGLLPGVGEVVRITAPYKLSARRTTRAARPSA